MKLIKLEEDFNNPAVRHSHYLKHVAQSWQDFEDSYKPDKNGFINPKFPPMSEEEYENEANKLAQEVAGKSSDQKADIIGFQLNYNNRIRNIKIRKKSDYLYNTKYIKGKINLHLNQLFRDVVVYKIENGNIVVISFMIGRSNSLFKNLRLFVDELEENK